MKAASILAAALLAACTTTVRDWPREEAPAADAALLAGRFAFDGSWIEPRVRLRSTQGRIVYLRPAHDTFLVSLPAGTYEITRFGHYAVRDDRVTIEAVAGRARYIGSFRAMRDEHGEVRVVVRDERADVERALASRYGKQTLEAALARSSLEPMPGAGKDLVIAVARVPDPPPPYWHAGIYYGRGRPYWYRGYYHHARAPRPVRAGPGVAGGFHSR